MSTTQTDFVTPTTQHFAEFPADGQLDSSTLSTQAARPAPPQPQGTDGPPADSIKLESAQTKEPLSKAASVPASKYQKLKRKFSALREEYLQTISGWEQSTKQLESLSHERKFLRNKLTYFLASKYNQPHISDEELTAVLLSQSASLQSRPAAPGTQMRSATSSTQIQIGKPNGHRHANNAAQNGAHLNGLGDDNENEAQLNASSLKMQQRLKAYYDQQLRGLPADEREKALEELQNNHKRVTEKQSRKQAQQAQQQHLDELSVQQANAGQAIETAGEPSSKIKINFAQLNGAVGPMKAMKQTAAKVQNSQMAGQGAQGTAGKHKNNQQQLPQLPSASLVVPSSGQQQQAQAQPQSSQMQQIGVHQGMTQQQMEHQIAQQQQRQAYQSQQKQQRYPATQQQAPQQQPQPAPQAPVQQPQQQQQ